MSTTALNPLGLRSLIGTGQFPADVAHAVDGVNSRFPQRRNRRLKTGFLSAADGDASAVAAQYVGDLQPESGGAAGNQRHLPRKEIRPERTLVGGHNRFLNQAKGRTEIKSVGLPDTVADRRLRQADGSTS